MRLRGVVRALIVASGICPIGWAIATIPVYRADSRIIGTARRILAGDKFSSSQLEAMRRDLAAAPGKLFLASAENGAVTMRLLLLEHQLKQGTDKAGTKGVVSSDIDGLRSRIDIALGRAPTSSFVWLAGFWLSPRGQITGNDLKLLRMSYSTGPNEGWIAVRRSPLALRVLGKLPDELASRALDEFVRLIRSGFYADAANILAGPAWAVRDQLLKRLNSVDKSDREAFAKAVDAKDLPGLNIPLPEARRNRPF